VSQANRCGKLPLQSLPVGRVVSGFGTITKKASNPRLPLVTNEGQEQLCLTPALMPGLVICFQRWALAPDDTPVH